MKILFLLLLTACASSEFETETIAMSNTSPDAIADVKRIIAWRCEDSGASNYQVKIVQINGGPQGEAEFICKKE